MKEIFWTLDMVMALLCIIKAISEIRKDDGDKVLLYCSLSVLLTAAARLDLR
jgi:hypothetical protein